MSKMMVNFGYGQISPDSSEASPKILVEELRQMGWTFTYIGADQDVEIAKEPTL